MKESKYTDEDVKEFCNTLRNAVNKETAGHLSKSGIVDKNKEKLFARWAEKQRKELRIIKFDYNIKLKNLIKKAMKNRFLNLFYVLLIVALFSSCNDYPDDTIIEAKNYMVVYKIEKLTKKQVYEAGIYGDYKYAVTDNSNDGFTLYSFNKYQVGDTLYISNSKNK